MKLRGRWLFQCHHAEPSGCSCPWNSGCRIRCRELVICSQSSEQTLSRSCRSARLRHPARLDGSRHRQRPVVRCWPSVCDHAVRVGSRVTFARPAHAAGRRLLLLLAHRSRITRASVRSARSHSGPAPQCERHGSVSRPAPARPPATTVLAAQSSNPFLESASAATSWS